jgi:prefoldin subunit 5
MTNYDKLRAEYLANPANRKLYEIETAKLELVETIDRLAEAKSAKEREELFVSIDHSVIAIKEHCSVNR